MRIFKRELTRPARRAMAALAGAALAVGLVSPALAAGGPPIGRIYDCFSNPTGTALHYVAALELTTRAAYLVAPYRKGNQLSGQTVRGSYTVRGTDVTFLTGPYGQLHYFGKWIPKHTAPAPVGAVGATLALLDSHSRPTGISCYPH